MPVNKLLTSDEQWKKFCDTLADNLKTVSGKDRRMHVLLALGKIGETERALFQLAAPRRTQNGTPFHAH